MKGTLYDINGKKKGEVVMPTLFNQRVRADIVAKYFEANKLIQPYSNDPQGGKKHSASGIISHKRHDWKGHYGRGISRLPRKVMWRRGVNFFWIGAEVSGTRGGRRAHGPKGVGKEKKINKKEVLIAMNSALASTGFEKYVVERYSKLNKKDVNVPAVIESKLGGMKTKDLIEALEKIFGDTFKKNIILKEKKVRAGRGKIRGRKYKSNAGLLLIKSRDENVKMRGIDVRNVGDLTISDLYPLGRLTLFTENSLSIMKNKEGQKI